MQHPAEVSIRAIMAAYPDFNLGALVGNVMEEKQLLKAEQLLTIKQTCERLSIKRNTVYNFIASGLLNPVHVGNKKTLPRMKESEVAKLIGERR
jgi:excisionase family DNA binding protein